MMEGNTVAPLEVRILALFRLAPKVRFVSSLKVRYMLELLGHLALLIDIFLLARCNIQGLQMSQWKPR
jgi:hypothetical protein